MGMNGFLEEKPSVQRAPGRILEACPHAEAKEGKREPCMKWKQSRSRAAQKPRITQEVNCTETRSDSQGLQVNAKMLLGFQGATDISKLLWATGSMSFAYKKASYGRAQNLLILICCLPFLSEHNLSYHP